MFQGKPGVRAQTSGGPVQPDGSKQQKFFNSQQPPTTGQGVTPMPGVFNT